MESRGFTWTRLRSSGLLMQILHYTLTALFIRGLQVLLTPIITRLLVPADYGYTVVFLQSVNLISGIAMFGMGASLTQVYLKRPQDFPDTLKSVLVLVGIVGLVVTALVPRLALFLATALSLPSVLVYFAIPVGIAYGVYTLYLAILIARQRSILATRYSLVNVSAAGLLFIVFLLAGERSYLARVYSYTIITAILLIASIRGFLPYLKQASFSQRHLSYALRFGIPAMFSGISYILFTYADRVILTRYRTGEEMGLFSFACVIGLLPLLLSGSALTAFNPHIYKRLRAGDAAGIKRLSHLLSLAVAATCLLVSLLARPLAVILADPSYHAAIQVVPILALYSFAFYMMSYSGTYLLYYEATSALASTYAAAALLNIVLNLRFIPEHGYVAAAWTTLASGIVHALLVAGLVRGRYGVRSTGSLLNLALLLLGGLALVLWVALGS